MTQTERALQLCREAGQPQMEAFLAADSPLPLKEALAAQILAFEDNYHGGLKAYTQKMVAMLKDQLEGKTKYDGMTLEVPHTSELCWDKTQDILETEEKGLPELKKCAFFLLAGGLGERLGFAEAKPRMQIESTTGLTYLQLYCEYIVEYQKLFRKLFP